MDRLFFSHIQEITDFLNNVVIKFSPFVDIFNTNIDYLSVDGYDENDPTTYPYYRMLTGDTAFATTTILGYSPVLKNEVILTKESVALHPDIVTFYRDNKNLKRLLNRYPNDTFLIRRLINPIIDINYAINAKNLTVIPTTFEDTFLDENERSSLLTFLQDILWKIDYRWYISPLEFEDLYPYAFWGILWNTLPLLLLSKRILNIKTIDVHPFHIWEYLKSKGFAAYNGYLTRNQEMFLYRNADYLKFHGGKKFLLDILENVFLHPLKYSISKRDIALHTYNRELTHDKYPEVIQDDESQSSISFSSFLEDIYDDGYDSINDSEYNDKVTNQFIKAPTNHLVTKFLAFNRNIDMTEMTFLIRFILDEIIYLHKTNKLSFVVNIQSPVTQNILQFDNVIDAISLFYYCIYKRNDDPTVPFKYHTLTTAIDREVAPTIAERFYFDKYLYQMKTYIDVDSIVNDVPYITDTILSSRDLSNKLGSLYSWLFQYINKLRSTSDLLEHEFITHLLRSIVSESHHIDVDQTFNSYADYFNYYPQVKNEVTKLTTDDNYVDMMYAIITGICPLEYGFAALARDDEVVSILIHKIKELFTYLVSYNITFLNPNFEKIVIFEIPKIGTHIDMGAMDRYGVGSSNTVGSLTYVYGNNQNNQWNIYGSDPDNFNTSGDGSSNDYTKNTNPGNRYPNGSSWDAGVNWNTPGANGALVDNDFKDTFSHRIRITRTYETHLEAFVENSYELNELDIDTTLLVSHETTPVNSNIEADMMIVTIFEGSTITI